MRELAAYERAADLAVATEADLRAALFGASPAVFAHVLDVGGEVAGAAVWFVSFSTWTGRLGMYLEDLFVRPAYRGRGFGRRLLATLAAVCVERGYARLEWAVLDWNEPALGFYRTLGATSMDEWTVNRLAGEALSALAASAPPGVAG